MVLNKDDLLHEVSTACAQVTSTILIHTNEDLFNQLDRERPNLLILPVRKTLTQHDVALIRKIRKAPDSHLLAILAITDEYTVDILRYVFRSGVEDCIPLPINLSIFVSRLENILYHSKRRVHVNALTGLPGIGLIEEEFSVRLRMKTSFAVAYCDIDNFKPFNDEKGVKAGDQAIRLLSLSLHYLRSQFSREQIFVGHLGGDDFFILGSHEYIKRMLILLYDEFSKNLSQLFSSVEVARGYYLGVSRDGHETEFPLLSISTAMLSIEYFQEMTFEQLSEIAARIKKKAKAITGNSVVEYAVK